MGYRVRFSESVAAKFRSFSPELRQAVSDRLNVIAESPASLSRPACFPYPEKGMQHFFPAFVDGEDHNITILFEYASDETSIIVIGIGIVRPG